MQRVAQVDWSGDKSGGICAQGAAQTIAACAPSLPFVLECVEHALRRVRRSQLGGRTGARRRVRASDPK
ncbi:hypothetical protein BV20DRAFT_959560 [Pilatotrama ljubarskyi]|nr:hypothetical protein BV20DRAFT_959560 [Pilatotrama ljubarskyi]